MIICVIYISFIVLGSQAGFFKSKYKDMINADEADPGAALGEPEPTPEA